MRFFKRYSKIFIILSLFLLISIVLASSLGAVKLPGKWIIRTLLGLPTDGNDYWHLIFWQVRLPRVLGAALVGAALALAGTAFQGVLRNPLADPYILGVSSGASLGAAITSLLPLKNTAVFWSLAAFAGALLVTFTVYSLASRGIVRRVEDLILAGVAMGSLTSSIVSIILVLNRSSMDKVIMWMMGSLSGISWQSVLVLLIYLAPGFLLLFCRSRELNALLLGEEAAWNLGVDVVRETRFILTIASLLAAVAVSVSGVIGFVGLMVPHILRIILGPDHRLLLPASLFGGAILLVITDCVARTVIAPTELPVGVITSLLGAPFFLYLLKRNKKN